VSLLSRAGLAPRAALVIALVCVALGLALWLALPPRAVLALMDEHGPVESVTALLYALCAVAVWLERDRARPGAAIALAVLLVAACLRELDVHKAYDGISVLRLSWYAGAAPLGVKLLAAASVGTVVAALLWLLRRHGRAVWQGWRRRVPLATTVVTLLLTAVAAKFVDRTGSVLPHDFGIVLTPAQSALRFALEESLELALAAQVVLGLVQRRAAR
jgi:hypothetical protein